MPPNLLTGFSLPMSRLFKSELMTSSNVKIHTFDNTQNTSSSVRSVLDFHSWDVTNFASTENADSATCCGFTFADSKGVNPESFHSSIPGGAFVEQ